MKKLFLVLVMLFGVLIPSWSITVHCFYNVANHMAAMTFKDVKDFRVKDGIIYFTTKYGTKIISNTWTIEYNDNEGEIICR